MKKMLLILVLTQLFFGCPEERKYRDEGDWCVFPLACVDGWHVEGGVDDPDIPIFAENEPICVMVEIEWGEEHPEFYKKSCTVERSGNEIVIHSSFEYTFEEGGCSDVEIMGGGCEEHSLTAHCDGPVLSAGEYTVRHGESFMTLTIPGENGCPNCPDCL
jgi:hypothetical protein